MIDNRKRLSIMNISSGKKIFPGSNLWISFRKKYLRYFFREKKNRRFFFSPSAVQNRPLGTRSSIGCPCDFGRQTSVSSDFFEIGGDISPGPFSPSSRGSPAGQKEKGRVFPVLLRSRGKYRRVREIHDPSEKHAFPRDL